MPVWMGQTVSQERYDALRAHYEEQAFQRRPKQGELCAPMVIGDSQPQMMSMTNGQYYDSKSELRKEYKRAGVVEVGNEKQSPNKDWVEVQNKRKKQKQEIRGALRKAHSQMGFGAP